MAEAVREARRSSVDGDEDATCRPSSKDNNNNMAWEIEEMESADDQLAKASSIPRQDATPAPAPSVTDDVYVAVGKGGSSMAALSWALRRLTKTRSFVYLVHAFPVVNSIPTPLGMMPKNQASPDQVETYMNQERLKRREMLQKYIDQCRNFQVNVDVYLIESDQIADAVSELIPVLTIKQLVLGVSKSNLRKLKKGSTIAGQIQKNVPLYCKVKIICDGKEVSTVMTADPTTPFSPSPVNNNTGHHTPTPPSSTPNCSSIAASDNHNDNKPNEKTKITKFLKCLTF